MSNIKESINSYRKLMENIFEVPRDKKNRIEMNEETQDVIDNLYSTILESKVNNSGRGIIKDGLGPIINSENYVNIPIEIRNKINAQKHVNETCNLVLKSGRVIEMNVIYEKGEIKSTFIDELYDKSICWLSYIDKISSINCSKKLSIYLLLGSEKKVIPRNKNEELDRQHVNSAFTFSCKKNNEIIIYRIEEVFKVLIHESFHSFGLDFSSMAGNLANEIICSHFQGLDKRCDYRIYESYCETWAQIINILILVSREKTDNYMKRIDELLYYERSWSIFQCAKVLYHYGLEYNAFFENEMIYTERKTQIFSYFILRAIAMEKIDVFINWSNKNNSDIIVFKKNQENVKSYCNLLCNISNNDEFNEKLELVEDWFLSGSIPVTDLIALKSMRMSLS